MPHRLATSALRLRRTQRTHWCDDALAGDVRQPAVAAARAAGLDGRRARVEADDARSPVGRHHFPRSKFKTVGWDGLEYQDWARLQGRGPHTGGPKDRLVAPVADVVEPRDGKWSSRGLNFE